jgi:YesN/AraC family two-component response regulator
VIRVLLADDQALVRAGIRTMLTGEPDIEVVAEAGTGAEALARTVDTSPDVVLMDIKMPGMDGLAATRRILLDPRCAADTGRAFGAAGDGGWRRRRACCS